MSHPAAEIFRNAARLNAEDDRRSGNVIDIEDGCEVIASGDIHGNRSSLSKIISYATCPAEMPRRLVLQEIIHGSIDQATGHDRSVELLLRAARLKVTHPREVLFVLSNHDIAQLTGNEITKAGRGVCKSFTEGVEFCFADAAEEVTEAIGELLASMPLAVRCPNGVFLSHSLPSQGKAKKIGAEILHRPYEQQDFHRGGDVYEWTWGRAHTLEELDRLADDLGVEFFILGHQQVQAGYEIVGSQAVVLASDHKNGCIVHFSTDRPITAENVEAHVKRVAALGRR